MKKAERLRIDSFELWCWRKLLRVPWTARRSNQSILKEISPGCSLEGLMLKLKLQYFGHLMLRVDSLEKTLMLGGPSSQDEALASYSVSVEALRSILKFKTIIGNLDVSTEVPRHPGLIKK